MVFSGRIRGGEVTDAALGFYRDQGYLIAEELVTPAEVEEIKADAVKVCRGGYPCPQLPPLDPATPDREVLQHYLALHNIHKLSPVMMRYVKHPGIAGVLARLIGPNVKCMQAMLFIKPPTLPGQAWHQDEYYIPTRDRSLTGGWIALDPATVENGCLWVVPGSHRTGYLHPMAKHGNTEEWDFADMAQGVPEDKAVPVEVTAGAVVFFNGYLLHSSRKNRSPIYRRVLVNHYMNAYSPLAWSGQADFRDVQIVAGEDPYAWKGYTDLHEVWVRPYTRKAEPAET